MARIFGWAADTSGCGYYRLQLPLQQLQLNGHQTLVDTRMPDLWHREAEVIVGQRVHRPGPSQRWLELARAGRFLVMELDDDLFNIATESPAYQHYNDGQAQERIRENIAAASRVLVSTPALADRIAPLHPDVRVLPNMIPRWLLDRTCCPPGHPVPERGSQFEDGQARGQDGAIGDTGISPPLTVGWAGSYTHQVDWSELARPVAREIARGQGLQLHLVGWCPPGLPGPIPPQQFRFTSWCDQVPDYLRALDFQIGLAPMQPHVFNACKSDLRLLELGALGIPAVASDYGAYRDWIDDGMASGLGVTGLTFRLPHQAIKQLRMLAADPQLRLMIGQAAKLAAGRRVIEDHWQLWEKALTP